MSEPAVHFRRLARIALPWRALLWAVVAAVFTMVVIQFSMRDGRLVLPPLYDDVQYFSDASVRLATFYEKGSLPVVIDYVHRPPHSPYSTLLGMAGFLVFGMRDWAPYAANGLLIFGYLAFADHLMRGLPLWQRLIGQLVMLSVPLTVMAAHEFRPDHACALLTVVGGLLILERPLLTASTQRLSLIGFSFGLALLTKTSTFPATLAMFVGTLGLATAVDVLMRKRPARSTRSLLLKAPRAWAICIGLAILIALPHFIVAWKDIYTYIYDNEFGYRKSIWKTTASLSQQLFYYVDPNADNDGGGQMLGRHVLLLYALLPLSACVTLLRPSRKLILRSAAMFLFLVGTYFVVSANPIKTVFFGLTFQTAFVMLGLATLRQLLLVERFRTPRLPWATVILVASLVVGVGEFRWPRRVGRFNEPDIVARRDIVNGIYDLLLRADPKARSKVVIDGLGDINDDLFDYYNARDQHNFRFVSSIDTSDMGPHLALLNDADFLVLSEPDTLITADFLLSYRVLPAMNAEIRRREDWKEIGYFVFPPSKKGFHVFQRQLPEFAGWDPTSATGLMEAEGPYPDWNLPIVRWGTGASTSVQFQAPARPVALKLSFRNPFQNQTVRVFLDQKLLWTKTLSAEPINFESVSLPLEVLPGTVHQIRITYSLYDASAPAIRTMLFKELAVLPR